MIKFEMNSKTENSSAKFAFFKIINKYHIDVVCSLKSAEQTLLSVVISHFY